MLRIMKTSKMVFKIDARWHHQCLSIKFGHKLQNLQQHPATTTAVVAPCPDLGAAEHVLYLWPTPWSPLLAKSRDHVPKAPPAYLTSLSTRFNPLNYDAKNRMSKFQNFRFYNLLKMAKIASR